MSPDPLTESKFEIKLGRNLAKFQRSTFSITPFDVKCALRKTKKKKTSSGVDLISANHFENATDLLVQHLSLLFRMSLSSGVVPQLFCIGQMTPISNKGKRDLEDCQSYHPITVSYTLFKIFESISLIKISCKCCAAPHQFGSQKESSRKHALYALFNVLADVDGSGDFLVLCALDIDRAFDSCPDFVRSYKKRG